MRIIGGQIPVTSKSELKGNGGKDGNTASRGYQANARQIKAGCRLSGGLPCLECPLPYCAKYETAFGVAIK